MKQFILFSLFAALCFACSYRGFSDWDFLVLSQSWHITLCKTEPKLCIPSKLKSHFTIHGLWQNLYQPIKNHFYPQCCGVDDVLDLQNLKSLEKDLRFFWPDLFYEEDMSTKGLYAHEWIKHG